MKDRHKDRSSSASIQRVHQTVGTFYSFLLKSRLLRIHYLAMYPKRDPREDHDEDAGHVHLYEEISRVPLEVERHLQDGEITYKFNFYIGVRIKRSNKRFFSIYENMA